MNLFIDSTETSTLYMNISCIVLMNMFIIIIQFQCISSLSWWISFIALMNLGIILKHLLHCATAILHRSGELLSSTEWRCSLNHNMLHLWFNVLVHCFYHICLLNQWLRSLNQRMVLLWFYGLFHESEEMLFAYNFIRDREMLISALLYADLKNSISNFSKFLYSSLIF